MSKRIKILMGLNPGILEVFGGKGGGPDLLGAIKSGMKGMSVDIIPFEEDKDISQQVSDVDIIIPAVMLVPEEAINAAPNLKGIVQAGIGLDTVDIETATKKNIPVVNEPEGSAVAMGEYAIMLMLCTMKRVLESRELMGKGIWFQTVTFELAGKTLGLIGLGRSAREFIKRARPFDMKIIGIDKYPDQVGDLGIDLTGGIDQLDYLLENSDVVSIHCPANAETVGMIDYDKICRMKDTAVLLNLARAGIINKEDFVKAMKEKRIMGAGLDVFWEEPMDPEDEILSLPNVFCTPHLATSAVEARLRIFRATGENIKMVLDGERPKSCVNL